MTVPHGQSFISYAAAPTAHDVTRCHAPSSRRSSETSEPAVRWWSVVACMVSIALVKQSLARSGFARTLQRIRDRSERSRITCNSATSTIARGDRVVALAAALYPGRALCLERSLVLYDRLRREGARVELRIGVQATPFAAHAWVTYRDEPVNDSAEHVSHFVVMPEPRA